MMMKEEELRGLKVAELKEELAKLGLSQAGRKDQLIERLLDHHQSQERDSVADQVIGGEKKIVPIPSVVDDEKARLAARAARFGITDVAPSKSASASAKHISPVDQSLISDPSARQRRIERFGLVDQPSQPPAKKANKNSDGQKKMVSAEFVADVEQLRARQERFGVTASSVLARAEAEEAKRRRAERFNAQ